MKFTKDSITLDKGELQALYECTDKKPFTTPSQPSLCSVHFDFKKRKAVATNGHLLVVFSDESLSSSSCEDKICFSRESVKNMLSLMKSKDFVTITKDGHCETSKGAAIKVSLCDFTYVDYERINNVEKEISLSEPIGVGSANLVKLGKVATLCGLKSLAITGLIAPLKPIVFENEAKGLTIIVMPYKIR